MKCALLLALPFCFCSLAGAQFRERPATKALRQSRKETHVEGDLRKVLDFPVNGRVSALCFSPSGDLVVATNTSLFLFNEAATRSVTLWDSVKEPGAPFEDRPRLKTVLEFSPDGKTLFFCGPQGLTVWRWPAQPSLDTPPTRVWTAPDVYNLAVADEGRVVCAAKKGSKHHIQLRGALDGKIVWDKESGLLAITALRPRGEEVRSIVSAPTGSACYWSEWKLASGAQSLPVDMGALNGFSASLSPDGKSAATISRFLSLIDLETGEKKVASAPSRPWYSYWADYYYDFWRYGLYRWQYDDDPTFDTGWATLFSPDGNFVVTLGQETVFYEKSTGVIEGRVYYSHDPFPLPRTTQAENDGIGCFSPDGTRFCLVRQARVFYSLSEDATQTSFLQRQVRGASAVEVYALGAG